MYSEFIISRYVEVKIWRYWAIYNGTVHCPFPGLAQSLPMCSGSGPWLLNPSPMWDSLMPEVCQMSQDEVVQLLRVRVEIHVDFFANPFLFLSVASSLSNDLKALPMVWTLLTSRTISRQHPIIPCCPIPKQSTYCLERPSI